MDTREDVEAGGFGEGATDEIDLVQLWLILVKRKMLISVVLILCLLGGGAFAYLKPKTYTYTTAIEIGQTLVLKGNGIDSVGQVIEPLSSVLAKIKNSYIPQAGAGFDAQKLEIPDGLPEVEASSPKGSNLILLVSKGRADQAKILQELHSLVFAPLLKDHTRIVDVPRRQYQLFADQEKIKLQNLEDPLLFEVEQKALQIELEAAKMKLAALDDQKKLLLSQKDRLAETKKLLREEIKTVVASLKQANNNRPKAAKDVRDEARAMTMLVISNQVDQNEKRLSALRERLDIKLEDQKETLQQRVEQNRRDWDLQKEKIAKINGELTKLKIERRRDIENQKNVIASIENKLNDLRQTRTLGIAVRSLDPTSPGKLVVLALAVFLGLFGGVFLAFFTEFLASVGRQAEKIQ